MTPAPPPFLRFGAALPSVPLVIAVPHAGRFYPPAIERDRAVAPAVLEALEDRHADRLVAVAVAQGAAAIVATHARAWIDLNRGEEEGDEATSPRARAGLGLVPTRLAGRPLWRRPPDAATIRQRLDDIHAPYHAAIAAALAAARDRHGAALLVDCHSMPPLTRPGRPGARIVIGDRHGASADAAIAEALATLAAARRIPVACNAPYAGAYTLARHGRPAEDLHAVQIEMDRSLYLAPGLRAPGEGMEAMIRLFADLCRAGIEALGLRSGALAAE